VGNKFLLLRGRKEGGNTENGPRIREKSARVSLDYLGLRDQG